jgi:peptidoglycan/LPS O-acetylase OafA/YrhL
MPWVDYVRTVVIFLVVIMHACVTYSHVGSWYVMSEREPSPLEKIPFLLWQASNQAFFMGLLFFVSGYFAHGSLRRRGAGGFLRERCVRLGAPTLFYMLVIHPFILLGLNPWHASFPPTASFYADYVRSGKFLGQSGPMWFTAALLIFCLVLVAIRAATGRDAAAAENPHRNRVAPSGRALWLLGLSLGVGTFLVRLVQPIGTNVLNLQLCFFPQYIVAFWLGLRAARNGWLLPLVAAPPAARAGWIALIGGPTLLLILLLLGTRNAPLNAFEGGWHWQAFALALWEQVTGVGLGVGLLAWFSRRLERESRPLRWLSDRCFAVYLLHAPILVALMMAFRALPQNPFVLAPLLAVTGLIISFLVADVARRIPLFRAIL